MTISFKSEQWANAFSPIEVTPLEMLMLLKPLPSNALSPILVTPLGMLMFRK